jgi:hypothetical protein
VMAFTKVDEVGETEKADKRAAESARNRLVTVKGLKVIVVTTKAIRFREPPEVCGDSLREVWVARSTIAGWLLQAPGIAIKRVPWVGDVLDIQVPRWVADDKELYYE